MYSLQRGRDSSVIIINNPGTIACGILPDCTQISWSLRFICILRISYHSNQSLQCVDMIMGR